MAPIFEISKNKVLEQYDKVKGICDVVSYSSKTNPLVSGILEDERRDCMFSLHLRNELKNIKDKSKVMFLAQGWIMADVSELVELGVRWFVVDNMGDLEIFGKFLDNYRGEKLNLMLRLRLKENTLRTEKYFVFGFKSEEINKLLVGLRGNSGIGKLGVHFHRKTQNMAEWNLKDEFLDSVSSDVLEGIDVVCIGGGLPSTYANTNVDVIKSVFKKVGEFGGFLQSKNIRMMVEPGRFIAAPAGKLKCKVIRVYDNNIIVNASVYNSDMDALIVPVKLLVEGEVGKSEGAAYCIKGCTPCSMDLFRYRVYLKDIQERDEIVFLNAGAYNFGSDFCELDKIESVIVD